MRRRRRLKYLFCWDIGQGLRSCGNKPLLGRYRWYVLHCDIYFHIGNLHSVGLEICITFQCELWGLHRYRIHWKHGLLISKKLSHSYFSTIWNQMLSHRTNPTVYPPLPLSIHTAHALFQWFPAASLYNFTLNSAPPPLFSSLSTVESWRLTMLSSSNWCPKGWGPNSKLPIKLDFRIQNSTLEFEELPLHCFGL